MKTILIGEEKYKKLFKEARGVPNSAIDDAKSIIEAFLEEIEEMYSEVLSLETEYMSNEDDFYESDSWEDDFSYDFYASGLNKEYCIEVFYDNHSKLKAETDSDGEITINFAPIKRIIDKCYERYENANLTDGLQDYVKTTVNSYLYPILVHELTHDVDAVGGNNDHRFLGVHHRLNGEDLRNILYFFSDQEINARISSSAAIMEESLNDLIFDPTDTFQSGSEFVAFVDEWVIKETEEELHYNYMKTMLSLIREDSFIDKKYISRMKTEKSTPYSLPYDLFRNDSRLKKNRNLKILFDRDYNAACEYVYHFYENILKDYRKKIIRTCYYAYTKFIETLKENEKNSVK